MRACAATAIGAGAQILRADILAFRAHGVECLSRTDGDLIAQPNNGAPFGPNIRRNALSLAPAWDSCASRPGRVAVSRMYGALMIIYNFLNGGRQ